MKLLDITIGRDPSSNTSSLALLRDIVQSCDKTKREKLTARELKLLLDIHAAETVYRAQEAYRKARKAKSR